MAFECHSEMKNSGPLCVTIMTKQYEQLNIFWLAETGGHFSPYLWHPRLQQRLHRLFSFY